MRHWYIEFGINGNRLLTIEPNCIGGDPDIGDYADEIRTAAQHLLSFVGREGEDDYWTSFDHGPSVGEST